MARNFCRPEHFVLATSNINGRGAAAVPAGISVGVSRGQASLGAPISHVRRADVLSECFPLSLHSGASAPDAPAYLHHHGGWSGGLDRTGTYRSDIRPAPRPERHTH